MRAGASPGIATCAAPALSLTSARHRCLPCRAGRGAAGLLPGGDEQPSEFAGAHVVEAGSFPCPGYGSVPLSLGLSPRIFNAVRQGARGEGAGRRRPGRARRRHLAGMPKLADARGAPADRLPCLLLGSLANVRLTQRLLPVPLATASLSFSHPAGAPCLPALRPWLAIHTDLASPAPAPGPPTHYRAWQPDLIHVTSPGALPAAAWLYSRLLRVPLVASYHTHVPAYLPRLGLGWLVRPGRGVRTADMPEGCAVVL